MQKHLKSNVQNTWRGIFNGYIITTKHLRVWASRIHQVFITIEPIVNEGERDANLLIEHLLLPAKKPLQPQTGKTEPRSRSHKSNFEKII